MSGKSDKDNDKFVASRVKDLDKLEEKAVKAGKTFTKLGNDEFEAFFGADDRDNEVEYRLLFTPLAILNEMDLIKNPAPFGDDFYMEEDTKPKKKGMPLWLIGAIVGGAAGAVVAIIKLVKAKKAKKLRMLRELERDDEDNL
jgi:hypothetical protein